MTKAQIRTAVRNLLNDQETDAGTLFPSNNVLLDAFIDSALEIVTLDLMEWTREDLLSYEDITLVSGTATYALTKEYVQIVCLKTNTSGNSSEIIPYYDTIDELRYKTAGETGEPRGWTLSGDDIYVSPTPSVAATSWARAWIITPEAATMATGGPTKLPRTSHQLIGFKAAVLAAVSQESKVAKTLEALYQGHLNTVRKILSNRVLGQPRFVRSGIEDVALNTVVDLTLKDPSWS
jgi:hypothetical protein